MTDDCLPEPIAVVCHDAGAANIILAWIRANPQLQVLAVMQGPAATLWKTSGGEPNALMSLDQAMECAASLLSGTSWASDLEHEARRKARQRRLPSISVIDHWVNYAQRFERKGEVVLPSKIWVTDSYALTQAKISFVEQTIEVVPNLYLQEQIRVIQTLRTESKRVLYVLEPIRYAWAGLNQPGEFEALDFFVEHMHRLGLEGDTKLRLRPHPSDAAGKYDAWMSQQQNLDVALDAAPTLAQAIGSALWVAGCETMALVVALSAGRKVVSTLPPAAPECRLPHEGLIHLRQVVETNAAAANPIPPPQQSV